MLNKKDVLQTQTRSRHQRLSQAFIERDEEFIKRNYGTIERAQKALLELERTLNYRN